MQCAEEFVQACKDMGNVEVKLVTANDLNRLRVKYDICKAFRESTPVENISEMHCLVQSASGQGYKVYQTSADR